MYRVISRYIAKTQEMSCGLEPETAGNRLDGLDTDLRNAASDWVDPPPVADRYDPMAGEGEVRILARRVVEVPAALGGAGDIRQLAGSIVPIWSSSSRLSVPTWPKSIWTSAHGKKKSV